MNIKVEITRTFQDKGGLLASAALVFDDSFIVKNLRVVDGTKGRFVAMPSFRGRDGKYIDTCFPLNPEIHKEIRQLVLDAYDEAVQSDGQSGI